MSGPPDGLPDTASTKEAMRRWPVLVLAGLGMLLLAFLALSFSRTWGFSPGEDLREDGLESIVVSSEEAPVLPPDVERFSLRPEKIYVYVVARRIPSGEMLEVRVERESASSGLSRLVPGGEGTIALERLGTRPGPGRDLDVIRFALRERSGAAVPSGDYTVSVYLGQGDAGPAGRKFFRIRG